MNEYILVGFGILGIGVCGTIAFLCGWYWNSICDYFKNKLK